MPRSYNLLPLTIAFIALGGCARETIREMASLKDDYHEAAIVRASKTAEGAEAEKKAISKAAVEGDDKATIETGSIEKSEATDACQGEHIAYQATREYLKNFGPRPPDEPGEKGPCRRSD